MDIPHGVLEIFTSVILWPTVTLLMEYIKKLWVKWKAVLWLLALIVWWAYALVNHFAPIDFVNNFVGLASLTIVSSVYAYELIIKHIKTNA